MYSCLIISNTHRCLTYFLFTQQAMYIQITNAICIHQKLLFTVYFFLSLPPNWYQFKKWHLQINFRLFWTRKKWKPLINVKNLHTCIKHILKHVWNHIFSLFSELFRENWKKCLPAIRKRGFISEFIFNLVPFTPISKTIEHSFLKMGANLKYLLRLNHL